MAYIKYRNDFRIVEQGMKSLRKVGVQEWIHYIRMKDPASDTVLRSIQKTFCLLGQQGMPS